MSTDHIVSLLIEERNRLEAAISALGSPDPHDDPTMPDWVKPKGPARKKRGMSAATRKRMAEGQKRRWADIRDMAAKDDAVAPKKKIVKAGIAEAVAPIPEDTEFKSKMSIAMAKAWAKRRGAARKKKKAS